MNNQDLDCYIDKFNSEKDITIDTIDHMRIFNYLKELKMYRTIGTLSELFDLKREYKTIKFAYDLQESVIRRLEKSNEEMANRIVKNEGLIKETEIKG